mgnify:CR=1 FL=1
MAISAPILAGYTLAHVSGYEDSTEFRGGVLRPASGAPIFQNVHAGVKKVFRLEWAGLTDAQKATVISAWTALAEASASFTPPTGGSAVTVKRSPDQSSLRWRSTAASGGRLLWETTLELVEV